MRILLTTLDFEGSSGWHIARTLRKMRHQVQVFDFGFLLVPPYKGQYTLLEQAQRQLVRLTNRLRPLRATILGVTNRRFLHQARIFRPDLILVTKGEQIRPETVIRVRELLQVPVVNWCFDDPFLWLEQPLETIAAYDHFFVVDPAYIEQTRTHLPDARMSYLPQCCDPDIHKTVALTQAERDRYGNDVCFVGSMYPNRVQMFDGLDDFDFGLWGNFWDRAPDAGLRRCYRGREVYSHEKTEVFNASKIILNTHHPQAVRATNLRTYEVTGCGAFLLSDRREELTRLYREGEEVICFEDREDLHEKVRYYLTHPDEREEIARCGQQRAYREHTYQYRLSQLVSIVFA